MVDDVAGAAAPAKGLEAGGEGGAGRLGKPSRQRRTIFVPEPAPEWTEIQSTQPGYSDGSDGSELSISHSDSTALHPGAGLGSTLDAALHARATPRADAVGHARERLSGLSLKRAKELARQRYVCV